MTVLVCASELFESDSYLGNSGRRGPGQSLAVFEQICEQAVREFDGTVVQCNEQGFLACFGYPVAYEDAARRAARAGLRMLDDLKALGERLRREHQLELNPWVGIHTGPAVVEAKDETVSLVGEARNVALRLENVAVPGQSFAPRTRNGSSAAAFVARVWASRKSKAWPNRSSFSVSKGSPRAGSLIEASAPADLSPLTGRDHEMSLLKDRWEQAQEGMGQVVLLVGEPGLGKSRLVYTLKEHVPGQMVEGETDSPVIEWRCSPHFQNTGPLPGHRLLRAGPRLRPRGLAAQARFDRLVHRLDQYDLARPETVPLWASLLSLPATDRFPPLSLSPARQREETFRPLIEWLQTRAARRPFLFIVEDLHWVDASTLEFLGQFLAESLHDRILTVLTFRPEFKTAVAGRRAPDQPGPEPAHAAAGRRLDAEEGRRRAVRTRSSSRSTTARAACRCSSKNSRRWCRNPAVAARRRGRGHDSPCRRTKSPPRCRI